MSSRLIRLMSIGLLAGTILGANPALAALNQAQRDWYNARLSENAQGRFSNPALTPALLPSTEPLADAVVVWDKLRRDSYPATFYELSQFLRAHPGWPAEATLRRRAERAILATTPYPDRLSYFAQFPPLTPTAKFRLAEAYLATGRASDAQRLAREAWVSDGLTPTVEVELLNRFGTALTTDDHVARADRLLWTNQTSAAARLLARLPADRRAWAEARMALKGNAPDAAARLALVPATLQNDPGLIVDRVQWMRQMNDSAAARQLLASSDVAPGAVVNPEVWMKTRLEFARAAARDGQYDLAYRIAAQHRAFPLGQRLNERQLAERLAYTDIEWLAGWTALRQLNRPEAALQHFQNFSAASQTPVSQSRGDYWTGRAAEAAGKSDVARRAYTEAGSHPDFFYGQLALERIGRPITLPPIQPVTVTPDAKRRFDSNEVVRAAKLLGELGDRARQGIFMRSLVERAETPDVQKLIADLAPEIGRPELGVLVGRAARFDGQLALLHAAYPKLPLGSIFDAAWTMIHAITRQESQFDRAAVSHANARGLMQLMPGTARETAAKVGMPYDYTRLTEDVSYNVMLGSTYYRNLLDQWGGNHVLAVASYNAGPGNVRKWIRANGDPRDPNVDVIDWIEAIPIYETRNYVQRVLENAVVYDLLHPSLARMPEQNRLSAYLGKRRPG